MASGHEGGLGWLGEGWLEVEAVDSGRMVEETLTVDSREEMDSVRRRKGRCFSLSESKTSSCSKKWL